MSVSMACILVLGLFQGASGRAFLGANPTLQAAAVRQELQGILSETLGAGHGVDADKLMKIKDVLSPMFNALPKNLQGRVSAPVMRYIVQRYFSQQHGWIIRGFEPHAQHGANEVNGSDHILQSKLPEYVRVALEEKFAHHGFALEDTAMMVAAVERLTFDEVIRGVETSFFLNELQTTSSLSRSMLSEVLSSYLMVEMLEGKFSNITEHNEEKKYMHEVYKLWDEALVFTQDVVVNDAFERTHRQNPFVDHDVFFFEDVARIAQRVSNDFGPASNHECHLINDKLAAMDVHATGRVKLSDFYHKASQDADYWEFGESVEYLHSLGALDESDSLRGPQVIIPNYVSGMSNCVTSAAYYSICCVNECDSVYQHLEKDISGPSASAAGILESMDRMSIESTTSPKVRAKLEEIASHHGGSVPMHGRLFAQWLHYAFPRTCPYPHAAGTVNPGTPLHFENMVGVESDSFASSEEVERYIMAESARIAPSPDAGHGMWSLHESLLESSTPSDKVESRFGKVLRLVTQFAMLGGLVLGLKNMMPKMGQIAPHKGKSVEYDV